MYINPSGLGVELSLAEAVSVFREMPDQLQLCSLHPKMVQIDAQRDPLLHPIYWHFRFGSRRLLHSFQLGDNSDPTVKDLQSAYGYGGPLSNSDERSFIEMAEHAFALWASKQLVVAEFFRFHPLVPHEKWYAGAIVENRETIHIDLFEDLFTQYQPRRRTDVRRFLKSGLRIERVSASLMRSIFPDLYAQNMNRVGATDDYYFPPAYFDLLFEFDGCENWIAFENDRAVAGAILLASSPAKVVEYFLGAQTKSSEQHKATIGLLHAAAVFYQSMGYRYFYLGGGRSRAADDSLLFFKKGFSPFTGQYRTASRVYSPQRYLQLQHLFPDKAATGRVLFYKD